MKPGNVPVAGGDLAKLTDFGISIWREVTLTDNGKISGTAAYVAQEVADGRPATKASDVFSLGAPRRLDPRERLVLVAPGQRYLRHEARPQPLGVSRWQICSPRYSPTWHGIIGRSSA